MNGKKGVQLAKQRQHLCPGIAVKYAIDKWLYAFLGHAFIIVGGLVGLLLLPALLVSHHLHQAFFASIYRMGQWIWGNSFAEVRRTLLTQLDGLVSHSESLKARGAVRVLEVGAAFGPNLEFMCRPVEYWKMEPNTQFDAAFQNNLQANPKVQLERSICGYGENMDMIPDGFFDAVLMTYVLCSAQDCRKLLDECKRVLRKGGLLLFSEHVGHPKGSLARSFEDFFTPLAKNVACGCHLNRDSGDLIRSSGFASLEMHELNLDIPFVVSRQIYGVATA
ncbi:thiol S-methyltransferase TMT1B-like isoform X1 [Dermacentor andersoni]|uniref:thiol S-methyltransferase TMT1B-like isoform X1 n=1 Tax=Dermacentor andersoni TaxID=34620 RepID=UPI002155875B|nr:thiol S-methyltransferase METTL7B-like isoform X1 [Dermacentor andersoni]